MFLVLVWLSDALGFVFLDQCIDQWTFLDHLASWTCNFKRVSPSRRSKLHWHRVFSPSKKKSLGELAVGSFTLMLISNESRRVYAGCLEIHSHGSRHGWRKKERFSFSVCRNLEVIRLTLGPESATQKTTTLDWQPPPHDHMIQSVDNPRNAKKGREPLLLPASS